ncbi:MAG: hypothetical protein K2G67_02375 [Muribaculaceae bacterium]|nr:hypothetical protein [Muribaculaceae bacterium]
MRRIILGLTIVSMSASLMFAQDDFDDIYYNPSPKASTKTDSSKTKKSKNKKKKSNYIADFSDMDIDEYNKRGFYYETDIDTIGARVESEEDFVYTQQIQKYYNPTIVVDNSDILADVLENSYGNVEVVVKNNTPVFTSVYYSDYPWAPGYYNWNYRPAWTWSYAWGPVSFAWNFGPSWTWSFGPSWAWYPGSYWGWGPGWGYSPWYPPYHYHRPCPPPRPYYAAYNRPGASRPVIAGAGWSSGTRPGGRPAPGLAGSSQRPTGQYGRPGSSISGHPGNSGSVARPGSSSTATRPAGIQTGNVSRPSGNRVDLNKTTHTQSGRPSKGEAGVQGTPVSPDRPGNPGRNPVVKDKATVNGAATINSNKGYSIGSDKKATSEKSTMTVPNKTTNTRDVKSTDRSNRNSGTSSRVYNSGSSNRSSNSGTSNRSYNSGSSNRSYSTGSSNRSYNSGASRSSGTSRSSGGVRSSGGSHGGGRGGRR